MFRLTSYSSCETFRSNCKLVYYCIVFSYIFLNFYPFCIICMYQLLLLWLQSTRNGINKARTEDLRVKANDRTVAVSLRTTSLIWCKYKYCPGVLAKCQNARWNLDDFLCLWLAYSIGAWCLDVVILFLKIATPPIVFVRFSRNLADTIFVPIRTKRWNRF